MVNAWIGQQLGRTQPNGLIERVIFKMNATHKATRTFVFYLLPNFTLIAFSGAVEALRLANNVLGFSAYNWRFVSLDGGNVAASCGVEIAVHNSIAVERSHLGGDKHPTMAIVCGGRNVERYHNKAAIAWLRESRHKGVALGSVCTGAFFLAQSGLLDGKRCTIHWENYPGTSIVAIQRMSAQAWAQLFGIPLVMSFNT